MPSPQLNDFYRTERDFIQSLKIDLTQICFDSVEQEDSKFQFGILRRSDAIYWVDHNIKTLLCSVCRGRTEQWVLIQAFLKQFRAHPEKLSFIEINKESHFYPWFDTRFPIYRQLLEIMLMPLNSYDDLYRAMQRYETVTGTEVLNKARYYDHKPIFSGKVEDWMWPYENNSTGEHDYVEKKSEHEYHIIQAERGMRTTQYIMYDIRHVYEYILSEYCKILW